MEVKLRWLLSTVLAKGKVVKMMNDFLKFGSSIFRWISNVVTFFLDAV